MLLTYLLVGFLSPNLKYYSVMDLWTKWLIFEGLYSNFCEH